ncbi:hypothetical protein R2221_003900 [Cronobacter sakazakii]|nr:hypothetical protein [Cronobacter sakazakii]ELY4184343.1 hypothetical protein [Cronobacter sakazakii]ELY4230389.1 hypothetical protein [Cronobacter sakazakii]
MKYTYTRTADDVLGTLKAYRDELHNDRLYMPLWPLLERLITREVEMRPVWEEIALHGLTPEQCRTLLEQLCFAGDNGTLEEQKRLQDDYKKLTLLNTAIVSQAAELAAMLNERDDIHNRNTFENDYSTDVVSLIHTASEHNGYYRSYLRETLEALRCRYDGKYWPSFQQLLSVLAHQHPVTAFTDQSDDVMLRAKRKALSVYLRQLFTNLHKITVRETEYRYRHIYLPADFRLTDAGLATLASVSLDMEDPATVESVKMQRHRLYKEGIPGVWTTPGIRRDDK